MQPGGDGLGGAFDGQTWRSTGGGDIGMPDFDGDAALFNLLQQHSVLLQQQPSQQHLQPQQQQAPGAWKASPAGLLSHQHPQRQQAMQQQQQHLQAAAGPYGALQQGTSFSHFMPAAGFALPGPQQPALYPQQQQAQPPGLGHFVMPGGYGGGPAPGMPQSFVGSDLLYQQTAAPAPPASTLPPAILQHQQAALARQQQQLQQQQQQQTAQLPFLAPPTSIGSTGSAKRDAAGSSGLSGAPNWALMQQQAAAAAAAATMMPVPMPVPISGLQAQPQISAAPQQRSRPSASHQPQSHASAAAAAATAAAAAAAAAAQHHCSMQQQQSAQQQQAAAAAARRRGRQPKDPSTLNEKQLRAREAQKRFRDKQKRSMAETEAAVGETSAELETLRISNESQKLKNQVLEGLLQYKEAEVDALEFQKQMNPPPRFVISADMVDMMRKEGIAGLFTPEVLLRYAVAGYTEHMDEKGEVKGPPPFEKVAEDWQDMVVAVRGILLAAKAGGGYHGRPAAGNEAAAAAADAQPRQERPARPSEVLELHSTAGSGSVGGGDGGKPDVSTAGNSPREDGTEVQQPERAAAQQAGQQAGQHDAAAGAAASGSSMSGDGGSGSGAGSGGGAPAQPRIGLQTAGSGNGAGLPDPASLSGSGGSRGSRRSQPSPITAMPENVHPQVAAIAGEATDEVLEATQAKDDPIARFVIARILSATAAHSHLQWDTLVDGAAVQDGPDLYRFSGHQLRCLANLMRRVGLMLWQQALLFPQHITKLGTLRLDNPNNLHAEEQDLAHWHGILRRLHCRKDQLEKIVAGHQRYIQRMEPVLAERAEALNEIKRMTEFQTLHAWSPDVASASFVQCTTRLTEATGLVMQTVSAQHAAYCELLIAVFYGLTFPVQRPQLFVLSWPYFPQLQLIGRAAALELGIDISTYPTYSSDAM